MATFGRKPVNDIIADDNLSPEEKTERIFSLYGQTLDEKYISKSAASAAQAAAIEQAKADALKDIKAPDVKESDEYKALAAEFGAYKTMQTARASADFSAVKPKFFETVYNMVDHADGAKPITEQLEAIKGKYEEYFSEPDKKPAFGAPTEGTIPTGKAGPSFMDGWGFVPKK